MAAGIDGESPPRTSNVFVALKVGFYGVGMWKRRMKIDRYIERLRGFKNHPILLFVKKASVSVAVDHCAFEAELRNATIQFFCRLVGVSSRQCGKRGESGRVSAQRIVCAIVRIARHGNGNVCVEGLGAGRPERQDLHINARGVHIAKAVAPMSAFCSTISCPICLLRDVR